MDPRVAPPPIPVSKWRGLPAIPIAFGGLPRPSGVESNVWVRMFQSGGDYPPFLLPSVVYLGRAGLNLMSGYAWLVPCKSGAQLEERVIHPIDSLVPRNYLGFRE